MTDEELKTAYRVERLSGKLARLSFLKAVTGADDDFRLAQLIDADLRKIMSDFPGMVFDVLIIMSALGSDNRITTRARRIYAKLISEPQCGRLALVGSNIFFKTMINFIVRAANASDRMKMFNNEAEAIVWLKK